MCGGGCGGLVTYTHHIHPYFLLTSFWVRKWYLMMGEKKEPKTNKIIYCLSICVIFFDYNSHISIIFSILLMATEIRVFLCSGRKNEWEIFCYRIKHINVSWLRDILWTFCYLTKEGKKSSNEHMWKCQLWLIFFPLKVTALLKSILLFSPLSWPFLKKKNLIQSKEKSRAIDSKHM